MQIFITGGSGFVGGAFIGSTSERYRFTAMSRNVSSDEAFYDKGAIPVRCALDDVSATVISGATAVVHCAAYLEQWGTAEAFWRVNVEGTKRMLQAAKAAGVKRFVHIGTEAALLKGQALFDVDETYPLALDSPFFYSRTKAHAEAVVRAANDPRGGFETIVVRPRFVWGPGDKHLLPALKQINERGGFVWVDGGRHRTSTTYIGNLCHAIERALIYGRCGEAYFILDDGGPVAFRDFLPQLTATAGIALKGRDLPGWLLRPTAFVLENAYQHRLLRHPPPISRFNVNIFSRDCILRDGKARRELGYVPPFSREAGLAVLAAKG